MSVHRLNDGDAAASIGEDLYQNRELRPLFEKEIMESKMLIPLVSKGKINYVLTLKCAPTNFTNSLSPEPQKSDVLALPNLLYNIHISKTVILVGTHAGKKLPLCTFKPITVISNDGKRI